MSSIRRRAGSLSSRPRTQQQQSAVLYLGTRFTNSLSQHECVFVVHLCRVEHSCSHVWSITAVERPHAVRVYIPHIVERAAVSPHRARRVRDRRNPPRVCGLCEACDRGTDHKICSAHATRAEKVAIYLRVHCMAVRGRPWIHLRINACQRELSRQKLFSTLRAPS